MGGIIGNGGKTTQPGSYASRVQASSGGPPGIKLEFVVIEEPDKKCAALRSGEVDFTWQVVDEMPLNLPGFQSAGVKVKAFVQIDWSRGGDACVASREIQKPEDIPGHVSAMMMFSPDHTVFEFMLGNSRLTPQQIARVRKDTKFSMDDFTFGRNLFCQGQADVACLWEPDVSLAIKCRPGAHRLFSTADATTLVADVLLAKEDFLLAHPEVAEKVARVFIEGAKIGNREKAAAARLVSTVLPRFRDEMGFKGTLESFEWVRWNDLADNARFFGLTGEPPAFDRVYKQADGIWSEYMDNDGNPVLTARFIPQTLRTPAIIKRIYGTRKKPLKARRPEYNPEVAKKGKVRLAKPVSIHFNTGKAELDTESRHLLKTQVLPQIQMAEGMSIRIEGNTDSQGIDSANQKLSEQRAQAVVDFLIIKGGIPKTRIFAKGSGESNPVATNKTEEGRARNRRTDILFVSAH